VDEITPHSQLEAVVAARAREFAGDAEQQGVGAALTPLARNLTADRRDYKYVSVAFDRAARVATITLRGPDSPPPPSPKRW